MSKIYSGIAIGGPRDGQILNADSTNVTVPDQLNGPWVYQHDIIGNVHLWRSISSSTYAAVARVFERYGEFRDFASGKTLEVINQLADRIKEVESLNLKLEERHTEDVEKRRSAFAARVELDDERRKVVEENNRLGHTLHEIRKAVNGAGVGDPGMTIEGRVALACQDLSAYRCEIENVRQELKATGHQFEGKPIHFLVDIAIDKERERHGETLAKIADAGCIPFLHGTKPEFMVEQICNAMRERVPTIDYNPLERTERAEQEVRLKLCENNIKDLYAKFASLNRWTQNSQTDPSVRKR